MSNPRSHTRRLLNVTSGDVSAALALTALITETASFREVLVLLVFTWAMQVRRLKS